MSAELWMLAGAALVGVAAWVWANVGRRPGPRHYGMPKPPAVWRSARDSAPPAAPAYKRRRSSDRAPPR